MEPSGSRVGRLEGGKNMAMKTGMFRASQTAARRMSVRLYGASLGILLLAGCAGTESDPALAAAKEKQEADALMVVDCLLPGQVRQLGRQATFLTPRRPIKTTASDCAIRGGEFTAFDRADYATALKTWLPMAQEGDLEAQTYVGEIYEKGLGLKPDYQAAAHWYRKAADAGFTRAQINLGSLYEKGLGVAQDSVEALNWYRRASGLNTDNLQYTSSITATAELQAQVAMLADTVEQLEQDKASAERARQQAEKARQKAEADAAKVRQQAQAPQVPAPKATVPAAGSKPSIDIIDPPITLTRTGPTVLLRNAEKEREIIGKVSARNGLESFYVNDVPIEVDEFNLFWVNLPVTGKRTPVELKAVDKISQELVFRFNFYVEDELRPAQDLRLTATGGYAKLKAEIGVGNYHALVIGNQDYQYYAKLETPQNDARQVAEVLSQRYGFNTRLLLNASRYEMLSAINELRNSLQENDNLLIYYAGHGEMDEANDRGYWLPIDAEPDNQANWISNTAISDQLNTMKARHIMVVADSCYAGTLSTASVPRQSTMMSDADRTEWLKVMMDVRARTVLTSGGTKPVLDAGANGHSVFAGALLGALRGNDQLLDGNALYISVLSEVRKRSRAMNYEQVPDYGAVKYAGHEAGEFFLLPAEG